MMAKLYRLDIKALAALACRICGLPGYAPAPEGSPAWRKGQTVVEYLLMLATIVGATLIFAGLMYRRILGGFFTVIGMVIGAGTPK